jgi:hypothetical protein
LTAAGVAARVVDVPTTLLNFTIPATVVLLDGNRDDEIDPLRADASSPVNPLPSPVNDGATRPPVNVPPPSDR